jgi:hypothetical protein
MSLIHVSVYYSLERVFDADDHLFDSHCRLFAQKTEYCFVIPPEDLHVLSSDFQFDFHSHSVELQYRFCLEIQRLLKTERSKNRLPLFIYFQL